VGLDPAGAKLVREIFRGCARSGVTVFVSTHTLSLVEMIADTVGVLHRGELLFQGPVGQLQASAGRSRAIEDAFFQLTREEEEVRE